MKRIFALLMAVITLSTASFAQTAKQTTKKVETKAKEVKKEAPKKVEAKAKEVKKEAPKMKADGTPDKRFKDNKAAPAKATGPKKADGTPDMRYKENKKKG